MSDPIELISIVSPDLLVDSIHSLLTARGHAVMNYGSVACAERSEIFYLSHVVVVDIGSQLAPFIPFINDFSERAPNARLILIGDCVQLVYADEIPGVFHCLLRPFTPEKLVHVVGEALISGFPHEKRRELRLPAGMVVELFHEARSYRTFTQNVSFHGMQVVWQDAESVADIVNAFSRGSAPISGCRLRVDTTVQDHTGHLNLPVDLRYITQSQETGGQVIMGFEFGDLDLDLRARICSVVAG